MEIPEGCPQADVSVHSGGSPEVSRAFLAMLIFCTEYFHNDVLSPLSQSLTPHFQMFTLPAQDQTLSGETTPTQQNFLHLPCQAQLVDPNLSTNFQLGMWLKPDTLPSTLFTLNCTNLLPVHFPLSSFQRAAGASQGLSQEGFAGKAQLPQISQLHKAENPIVSSRSSWWGIEYSLGADKVFLGFSFPAIHFYSGVVVVKTTVFCFIFLIFLLDFVLSKESMIWFLKGSELPWHLCCIYHRKCRKLSLWWILLSNIFQSKTISNNYFWSPLASMWPSMNCYLHLEHMKIWFQKELLLMHGLGCW